jgi:hypothetical protein
VSRSRFVLQSRIIVSPRKALNNLQSSTGEWGTMYSMHSLYNLRVRSNCLIQHITQDKHKIDNGSKFYRTAANATEVTFVLSLANLQLRDNSIIVILTCYRRVSQLPSGATSLPQFITYTVRYRLSGYGLGHNQDEIVYPELLNSMNNNSHTKLIA